MLTMSRRNLILSAAGASATLGLSKQVAFVDAAFAQQKTPAPGAGFKHFGVGDIKMTAVYDGIVDRPNAPGFIKNASVDDARSALKSAGLAEDVVPNPFTVPVARVGGKTILFDAGTGGQIAPTAGLFAENLKGAGIDASKVDVVLVSHFHPDHISGLMAKETNAPIYPAAEIVMPETEYKWWTDPAVFGKLPETRHGLARRIQAVFPAWKDKGQIRLVGNDVEVAPGIRSIEAPGHTPGHMAFHVSSGSEQLFVLADVATYNPVFLRNPGWHGSFDADGPLAETNRRKLLERAVAEKALVTAYHFVFPAAGKILTDGAGYAFDPVA